MLIRAHYNDSIAEASRRTGIAESTIQDILKMRGTTQDATLYRLAKGAGHHLFQFFEAGA